MVLYAKGWYKHSKSPIEDLKRCIYCDGEYVPQSVDDVIHVMLTFIERNCLKINCGWLNFEEGTVLSDFYMMVKDKMTWRIYQNNLLGIESEAVPTFNDSVIMSALTILRTISGDKFDLVYTPNKNVLPLSKGSTQRKIKQMFKKSVAFDPDSAGAKYVYESYLQDNESLKALIAESSLVYPKQHRPKPSGTKKENK